MHASIGKYEIQKLLGGRLVSLMQEQKVGLV